MDEYWEKKSEAIRNMSLKELRARSKNAVLLFENKGDIVPQMEEGETFEEAVCSERIQQMSLKELRALKPKHRLVVIKIKK